MFLHRTAFALAWILLMWCNLSSIRSIRRQKLLRGVFVCAYGCTCMFMLVVAFQVSALDSKEGEHFFLETVWLKSAALALTASSQLPLLLVWNVQCWKTLQPGSRDNDRKADRNHFLPLQHCQHDILRTQLEEYYVLNRAAGTDKITQIISKSIYWEQVGKAL